MVCAISISFARMEKKRPCLNTQAFHRLNFHLKHPNSPAISLHKYVFITIKRAQGDLGTQR